MKRIIDIDKLQEAHQRQKKQKSNYWQRIKNDPVKFGHYKEWRKQYVNKKEKEVRAGGHHHPSSLLLYHLRKFVRI